MAEPMTGAAGCHRLDRESRDRPVQSVNVARPAAKTSLTEIFLALFTIVMLSSPGLSQPQDVQLVLPTREAVGRIVDPLGFKVVLGSGLPETVTVKEVDFEIPWTRALFRVAPGLWKRIGNRVVVFHALGGNVAPGTSLMEYLLEEATAAQVIPILMCRHPRVCLIVHRTMNGFYAGGSLEDLMAIKRELADLDRILPVPESMLLPLRHLPTSEVVSQLALWVPEARWEAQAKALKVFGTPAEIAKASMAVSEVDRTAVHQTVSEQELAEARAGRCQFKHKGFDLYRLVCPGGDCGGILHKTGLRNDDVVYWQSDDWGCWGAASLGHWTNDTKPYQPFWSVTRDGVELNIFLQVH